ncbi:hypothetical protein XENTR_v10011572 [Xenopus tropicalis]|nr:hypothetical protein XENTR_v10011572 [Xenopus tropicalis]
MQTPWIPQSFQSFGRLIMLANPIEIYFFQLIIIIMKARFFEKTSTEVLQCQCNLNRCPSWPWLKFKLAFCPPADCWTFNFDLFF